MIIYCKDLNGFYNAISDAVQRGLQFKAYQASLEIHFTGGF